MTLCQRVLFSALCGIGLGVQAVQAQTAPARTAPDQPGVGAGGGVLPPAPPKRRFNERVTFHQIDPLLPPKPSRGAKEVLPEAAPREEPRLPRAFDPVTDARRSPPPDAPTEEEVQEALRSRNWLDPALFQGKEDRADRERIDEALGLSPEEEESGEEDTDPGATGEKSRDGEGKATFGDFFERMKKEALELGRVQLDEEDDSADAEEKTRAAEEKKTAEADEKRTAKTQESSEKPESFAPVSTSDGAAARNAQAGNREGSPQDVGPTPFTPVFENRGATAARGPGDSPSFPKSSKMLAEAGLAPSRLSTANGNLQTGPAVAETSFSGNSITGNFRSMDVTPRGESAYGSTRDSYTNSFASNPGSSPRSALNGPSRPEGSFGNPGGRTPAPSAGSFGEGRSSIAPPPGTGFQSGFSALRPAAALAPAVDFGFRSDRWERDRMKSQLLGDNGGGANRTTRP